MRLAFVLFKYFAYGGLQRDMLRIAEQCRDRGHEVEIYTMRWEGAEPKGIRVEIITARGRANHARYRDFHRRLQQELQRSRPDRVIGFNKMPGLDFYYAADPCLYEKLEESGRLWRRLLPRYRHFLEFERAVFAAESNTRIMMLAPRQIGIYRAYYGTQPERMQLLPPGIGRDRMAPANADEVRADFRREFGLQDDELLILCIGSGFRTKGLDRSLRALAALPPSLHRRSRLIAIGADNPAPFRRLASRLGVADRFRILSGRSDIPRFLQGGDLLLHPAYSENSGMVLLEAVVAGLPVLTTENCGYAFHVAKAGAGLVLPLPFDQRRLNQTLAQMLVAPERTQWRANGIQYGRTHDLYSMPQVAAEMILAGAAG